MGEKYKCAPAASQLPAGKHTWVLNILGSCVTQGQPGSVQRQGQDLAESAAPLPMVL